VLRNTTAVLAIVQFCGQAKETLLALIISCCGIVRVYDVADISDIIFSYLLLLIVLTWWEHNFPFLHSPEFWSFCPTLRSGLWRLLSKIEASTFRLLSGTEHDLTLLLQGAFVQGLDLLALIYFRHWGCILRVQ